MINGRLFVVINTCPPACCLQAVISHSILLAGLTHLYVTVKFKSPKQGSCLRSWCTGLWRLEVFAQVLVCEGSTLLWRSHLHDMFKSCTLRRYQDFRLGCIFFLFLFSLVLSSLSKCNVIAFMLHLRGGVKGIIVNVLVSRVWDVSHVYIALWASLNTYTVHSLFLTLFVTTWRPNSQAFFATNPEVIITVGLEVFVQLVIAAITMLPCLISAVCPWKSNFTILSCKSFGIA